MNTIRVHNYYPSFPHVYGNSLIGTTNYISTLDGENPVVVTHNHFADNYCIGRKVVDLFAIVRLYNKHVPVGEDWFVCKQAGLDFDTNIRDRNIRKYTKGLVFNMLLRLCEHGVFKCFLRNDVIKNSWRGEQYSFFRPYYPVHVECGRL